MKQVETRRVHRDDLGELYGRLFDWESIETGTKLASFDVRDELLALKWLEKSGLSREEARRVMWGRVRENYRTYCLEKDMLEQSRTYLMTKSDGRWQITTDDHSQFKDLSHMALAAAKKVRAQVSSNMEMSDKEKEMRLNRETAMLVGVRRLSSLLSQVDVGKTVALFYPPLIDGGISMLYTYTVTGASEGRRVVAVNGRVTNLNADGVNRLFTVATGNALFFKSEEEQSRFFTALPFVVSDVATVFEKADEFMSNKGWVTDEALDDFVEKVDLPALYYVQMDESATFLFEMLWSKYQRMKEYGVRFSKEDLEDLELVFSMARNAVLQVGERNSLVSKERMFADYRRRKILEWLHVQNPLTAQHVISAFNVELMQRYGGAAQRQELAVGCPAAVLAALGLPGGEMDSIDPLGHSGGYCPEIKCKRCGCTDIPENAKRCPQCNADSQGNLPANAQEKAKKEGLTHMTI